VIVSNVRLQRALAREQALADERRMQIIELNIILGNAAEENGDSFTAVLRFAEALRLDEGRAEREMAHRKRIAATLRNCPRLVHLLIPERPMLCAALPASGPLLALTRPDHAVEILDVRTGRRIGPVLPHEAAPLGGAFSADGRRLATICPDGAVNVWDVDSARVRRLLPEKGKPVTLVAFDPAGQILLTRNDHARIRLWRLTGTPSEQILTSENAPRAEAILHAALSDDGRWLFTVDRSSVGRLWDVTAGKAASAPMQCPRGAMPDAISPDGRLLALIGAEGAVKVRDLGNTRAVVGQWETEKGVRGVRFSPDGKRILSLGDSLRIWSTQTGTMLAELRQHKRPVVCAYFSPDGRNVISGDEGGGARVWDAGTGKALTPPLRHARRLVQAAFRADGNQFLAVGAKGTASVWEWPSKQDLVGENSPVEELVLLARVLACEFVDEKQQCRQLEGNDLRCAWEQLQGLR
jgi:WD40 repeat protein